jgi:chitinase
MLRRGGCIVLACVLALAACAAPVRRQALEYRLVGYVVRDADPAHIAADKLTALNFAFAQIDDNGVVVLQRAADADYLARLRALKSRNPRLKLLISVGGWGADGFSEAALSEASRSRFAENVAELIAHHQLDGIDVDWEYPGLADAGIRSRPEDKHNFTLMLQRLRERFDRLAEEQHRRDDPYLITAALADHEFVANIELARVGAILDWVNLMTYDFHGSLTKTTGHHSALHRSATSAPEERSVESAVAQFLAAGVPARKLVVGVPFYGKEFLDVNPVDHGLDQPFSGRVPVYPWPQLLADFIDRNGYVRYWDDAAQVPYLWNAQTHAFISYDDTQSLKLKAEYVKVHGLGGMMYWEQSLDPDDVLENELARELR